MDADPRLLTTRTEPRRASPANVVQEPNIIQFPPRQRRRSGARLNQWVDALLAFFSADPFEPKERSAEIVRFRRDPFRQTPP
jgi:hypothetical protein